ncbi:MAG TPA: tetratricopeptide repeat protein, partial [Candidatus Obscuribacterales bacterium]
NLLNASLNLGLIRTALKEYDQAAEAFEKALEISPNALEIGMYCGVSYLLMGNYEIALEKLFQVQAKGLRDAEVDLWIGQAYLALGRLDEADTHFERAVLQDGNNYLAFDGWGCCFALRERHQEAVERFSHALRLKPDYALAHLHMARSLEELGQSDLSRNEYQAAVQIDPDCFLPEKEAIELLLRYSNFDLVTSRSLKLLEINPQDTDARLSLARAYKGKNQLFEARQLLESVVAQDRENWQAFVSLGQVNMAQGQFVDADECFRLASELNDSDSQLFYSWGKTLALLGLHELALEKFEKAVEIDPYDGDVYEAWGSTLKQLGRFAEAAEVYKRAAEYI